VNNFLNQLNLTAQERRIVAIIFLVVIVVLNFLFVWPHFGEWSSINKQLSDMYRKIDDQYRIIGDDRNTTNGWQKQVVALMRKERNEGSSVAERGAVDPQVQLQNTILAQQRKTGVNVPNITPGAVKTNDAFFEEHSIQISVEGQEPQLINFLYNMGNDSAMIRVAKLDLRPFDANRYRLKGLVTLTANYQKKPPSAAGEATTGKTAQGAKPAGAPGAKPAAAPGAKPNPALGARPAGFPPAAQPGKRPPGASPSPGAKPQPPAQPPGGPIPNRPRRTPVPVPGQQ
jgi:hypothetical protein